jgi:hypothetical protein
MQNKGLVLSMADVQALRNAGFEPKGNFIKQPTPGYAEGGTVSKMPDIPNYQEFLQSEEYQNMEPGGQVVTPVTIGDQTYQFGTPMEAQAYQAFVTRTQGQPAATQREMLLGEQGVVPYQTSQQNLQDLSTQFGQAAATAPQVPAATTPTYVPPEMAAPTPADFGQGEQAVATQAVTPTRPDLATAEAVLASDNVKAYLDQVRAAQGEVAANSLVTAATQDPNALSQLQLNAAQIEQAQTVAPTADRTVQEGEMISGPAVEQQRVEDLVTDIKAATAEPSELATVQGQLAQLTANFDANNPPAWAAGALRAANAQLAARGIGASSMAGQAIIQATFEAATPIAAADAATVARFEQMNLSNRQQATMLAAQQRAQFLGQEFDQAFQTRVANASRISEIANMNFNADVQIALENARLAQSVDIANLNASNAKVLADAAAMANMDLANLNNRQQTAVANAKAFLDMDMANLSNEQQTVVMTTQQAVQAMFTDQAAENAAVNLNTTSENQLNQFFTNLEASVAQFNAAQKNAIAQSNVSELNALTKFKEEQANNLKISYDRNQTAISTARLSANTSLITSEIAAASARTTAEIRAATDTAISMAANEAKVTLQEMEQQYQREADIMAMSYDTMASNSDKAFKLVELDMAGQIELEAAQFRLDAAEDASFKQGLFNIGFGLVEDAIGGFF